MLQQEFPCSGFVDPNNYIGQQPGIRLGPALPVHPGQHLPVPDLIAESLTDAVVEMGIFRIGLLQQIQQLPYMGGTWMPSDHHGRLPPDVGAGIAEQVFGSSQQRSVQVFVFEHDPQGMHPDGVVRMTRGGSQDLLLQAIEPVEHPKSLNPGVGTGIACGHFPQRRHRGCPEAVDDPIGEGHPQRQVGMIEGIDQFLQRGAGIIHPGGKPGPFAGIHDPPDAATLPVAARMVERHLVMADDAVIKIGDIQCSVRSQLHVHRPEPGIVADNEIFFLPDDRCGAMHSEVAPGNPAQQDVTVEKVVPVSFREMTGDIVLQPGEGRRSVSMLHERGAETEPRSLLSEMRIIGAPYQLIYRAGMVVYRIGITELVKGVTERIDAAGGGEFQAAAVHPEAEGVAGVQDDGIAVGAGHPGSIGKAVVCMYPAVPGADEVVDHAVGVLVLETRIQDPALVDPVVAVVIDQVPDMGDAVGYDPIRHHLNPDGDIQRIGENGDLVGCAVAVGIFQDGDLIFSCAGGIGEGILVRLRHPHSPFQIEGHIQGLADIGLSGEELGLEAGRQLQRQPFRFRG